MKASEQVAELEKENELLKVQVHALRKGNVVLLRRDGFYQVKGICPSFLTGYTYVEAERDWERLPHRVEEYSPAAHVVHFINTRRKDDCGRWIFEET